MIHCGFIYPCFFSIFLKFFLKIFSHGWSARRCGSLSCTSQFFRNRSICSLVRICSVSKYVHRTSRNKRSAFSAASQAPFFFSFPERESIASINLPRHHKFIYKKESCKAGFSACGGSRKRHLPIRRSAILAERFLFHRNAISYEIKYARKSRW